MPARPSQRGPLTNRDAFWKEEGDITVYREGKIRKEQDRKLVRQINGIFRVN